MGQGISDSEILLQFQGLCNYLTFWSHLTVQDGVNLI